MKINFNFRSLFYLLTRSLVCLSICLLSCKQNQTQANELEAEQEQHEHAEEITLTEKQMQTVDIQFGTIEKRDLTHTVLVSGEIELDPQKRADVNSLVGGIIRQILVTEGKTVNSGQVLAYLENTGIIDLQKDYLTAKKEMLVAEQEYNRQQELATQGAGVEKMFQQATANYEISKARLAGFEKQLQQLSISPEQVAVGEMVTKIPIKAPIAGTINKININTGSYVDIQTSLMSISDNSQAHCDLKVFEKDIHFVQIGQEVDIKLTNQTGILLQGTVYEINKVFENDTKAISVHTNIKDKKGLKLLPGMYVTALIKVGKQKSNAVPNESIINMEGKKYIFILEDEAISGEEKAYHFKRVEVFAGISELGFTQITPLKEIAEDAKIVVTNTFYVASLLLGSDED